MEDNTCTEIQSRRDFFEWYFGGLFDGELYFWPCSTAKIFNNVTFESCE